MKKTFLFSFAVSALITSCNNMSSNPDTKKDSLTVSSNTAESEKKAPIVMPDSATVMKNWQAYMTPGEVHKMITSWNGKWTGESSMWMKPDAPPVKNKTSSESKMVFGDRYQITNYSGDMMGMPFQGMSTLAYDNAKKEFISTWIDNMGTGMMVLKGTWDEATKTITTSGKCVSPDLNDGTEMDIRETLKIDDKDHQTMSMYAAMPGEKEIKTMEIKLTRIK